eukprot:SAG31_NODE_1378_length_8588_cov_2.424382_9_plen_383_part_00
MDSSVCLSLSARASDFPSTFYGSAASGRHQHQDQHPTSNGLKVVFKGPGRLSGIGRPPGAAASFADTVAPHGQSGWGGRRALRPSSATTDAARSGASRLKTHSMQQGRDPDPRRRRRTTVEDFERGCRQELLAREKPVTGFALVMRLNVEATTLLQRGGEHEEALLLLKRAVAALRLSITGNPAGNRGDGNLHAAADIDFCKAADQMWFLTLANVGRVFVRAASVGFTSARVVDDDEDDDAAHGNENVCAQQSSDNILWEMPQTTAGRWKHAESWLDRAAKQPMEITSARTAVAVACTMADLAVTKRRLCRPPWTVAAAAGRAMQLAAEAAELCSSGQLSAAVDRPQGNKLRERQTEEAQRWLLGQLRAISMTLAQAGVPCV